MPRTTLFADIAATLRAEVSSGAFGAGHRLPSEAELARRFDVNRHTVRRALAALAEEGLVHARRGSGVFVTAPPAEYPLGRRVRFHRALEAAGRLPGREIRHLATRPADGAEAERLALPPGAPVHLCEGVSLSDGVPIAVFRSVFPAGALPGLPAALRASNSVTAALAACGVADYTRALTRLSARAATATQAVALRCAEGAPLLYSEAVNVDAAGRPVEYGRTWFEGERITLIVTPE